MKHIFTFVGAHTYFSETESRLCYMSSLSGPTGPSPRPERSWFEKLAGSGVGDYSWLWGGDKNRLKSFPKEAQEEVTNQMNWITIFKEYPGLFTGTKYDAQSFRDHFPHIADLVSGMTIIELESIYIQFVDRFLPLSEQQKLGIRGEDSINKFQSLREKEQFPVINAVFSALMGDSESVWGKDLTEGQRSEVLEAAKNSLIEYYKDTRKNFPAQFNNNLVNDYRAAMELQSKSVLPSAAVDVQIVSENLPASRLKGAIKLGVIQREDLIALHESYIQDEHGLTLLRAHTNEKLHALSGDLDARNKNEAMHMRDVWYGMSGAEKLILIGAVGYLLYKSKIARGAAIGMTAVYFGQKFLLKDKDPLKTWSAWANSGIENVKGANAYMLGNDFTPGYVDEVSTRAGIMFDYLQDFEKSNIQAQATGFALMADMQLSDLANNFRMAGGYGEVFDLTIDNPVFNKKLQQTMEANGWKRGAHHQFFESPDNEKQVTEGIGYVFYDIARRDPKYADDADLVARVLGRLPEGTTLNDLGALDHISYDRSDAAFHREVLAANAAYIRLVARGRDAAMTDGRTLKEFVSQRFVRTPSKVVAHAEEDDQGGIPDTPPSGKGFRSDVPPLYNGGRPPDSIRGNGGIEATPATDPGSLPENDLTDTGGVPPEDASGIGGIPETSKSIPNRAPDTLDAPPFRASDAGDADTGGVPDTPPTNNGLPE